MTGVLKPAGVTVLVLAAIFAALAQQELVDLSAPPADGVQQRSGSQPLTDRPPLRLRNVMPVYPEAARSNGTGGVVIVSFIVGVDGTVTSAAIVRSVPLLDQAALDAVTQWRFEPALSGGVAVPATRVTAFTFPSRSAEPKPNRPRWHQ